MLTTTGVGLPEYDVGTITLKVRGAPATVSVCSLWPTGMLPDATEHPELGGPAVPACWSGAPVVSSGAGVLAAARGDDLRGPSVALAVDSADELEQPATAKVAMRNPRAIADRRDGVRRMNTSLTHTHGLGFLLPSASHVCHSCSRV